MLLPENGTIKTYSATIWNLNIVIKIRCGYQRQRQPKSFINIETDKLTVVTHAHCLFTGDR